ncbi:probable tRNA methyltransferase 9B [Phycodurus eques]|uniref:probable tRNA methyltransferase 9B n=1 Tax=Phycodurus eques TaxID=693459 RepID=UPI002ACE1114|nr:probable tRNA methyltransferase 9B [Phycodurus eques]XP_061538725.1 probable tRNA methyltransferase 9B [Phycodurus eques]XP_061538726.1 probable tRNA methyltransferase 9B [Phycodurus eques]
MMDEAASRLEREHVHGVYDKIAPYFNDSRYKAWPKVRQFLLDQPSGSIVADVGCGNGKYLHINEKAFKLGCDVCRPLVDFAGCRGHEVQVCDGLRLPYRDGCFDAVLSIAVIHHLSTKERRIRAIKEMARTLRTGGRVMIYVWAMEQKRRKFEKQDIFVPWNPNPQSPDAEPLPPRRRAAAQSAGDATDDGDKHRKVRSTSSVADAAPPVPSNHRLWFFSRSLDSVFDFGSLSISRSSSRELSTLSPTGGESEGWGAAGLRSRGRGLIQQFSSFFSPPSTVGSEEDVFGSGTDLHKEPEDSKEESVGVALAQECGALALPDLVPFQRERPRRESAAASPPADGPCLRYYHVFREGELAELIGNHVEELLVRHAYFDHANWCVVAEKVQPWKI